MKLAIFDDFRLGVVSADEGTIADVTAVLPAHDRDPVGAGWWVRLCRDFAALRPRLEATARNGTVIPLAEVTLRAPVLNPGKIVAAAANYADHVAEMDAVKKRVGSAGPGWLGRFDVFLKAPSSIVGPSEAVVLPARPVAEGREIHHKGELAFVIGAAGSNIRKEDALSHVLGYTIALDMTVRGDGDRSRRKSYDTFTPIGPWIATSDEVGDPHALRITLSVNGRVRQDVQTSGMTTKIPVIIAYASSVMRLDPGDVVLTGAPAGVARVSAGDVIETTITRIGTMRTSVRGA